MRQLASRAREHVKAARPRFAVSQADAQRLASAFMAASAGADVGALSAVLAQNAILVTDGGGRRKAALRVMVGRDIIGLFRGLAWRNGAARISGLWAARINGYPGFVMSFADGPATIAFEPGEHGQIAAIYMVRNPEKLTHVSGG